MGEFLLALLVLVIAWLIFKSLWAIIIVGLAFIIVLHIVRQARLNR